MDMNTDHLRKPRLELPGEKPNSESRPDDIELQISIRDEGEGFDPSAVEDPLAPLGGTKR